MEYCSDFSSGIERQPCLSSGHNLSSAYAHPLQKLCIYLLIHLQIAFQNCRMAACSQNGRLTPACVRLKKEIINIALEVGCELMTALGTRKHTCSTVLCCYTFPRGWNVILHCHYISAPINYWLSPLQHFQTCCGNGPRGCLPHTPLIRQNRIGHLLVFTVRVGQWSQIHRGKAGQGRTSSRDCTLPAH